MRHSELTAHLKEGTIAAHCEVVRDLAAYGAHKTTMGNIGVFLRATQDVLSQEWAMVEGTTLASAVYEISSLLEKGRQMINETAPSRIPQVQG